MTPNLAPDGTRKRRHGDNIKARWYALSRTLRFADRFGFCPVALSESWDDIQTRAYFIWLNSGGNHGHDLDDILQAINEIQRNRPVEIHRAISLDRATIWRLLGKG